MNKTLKKKNIINLYSFWHLGDIIFVMIYLYNCKDFILKNNIKIHFYIRENLIKQVREFICCENVKIHPIKFIEKCEIDKINNGVILNTIKDGLLGHHICKTNIPKNSIDVFHGYNMLTDFFILNLNLIKNYNEKESLNKYLCKYFTNVLGKKMNFPGIKKFVYTDPDLLKRYDKLPLKYKNVDILIINSTPRSAQFDMKKNGKDFNNMIYRLSNKYKVVTTEKIDDIVCTADNKLTVKDIAAISTHADYIIGINTGPFVPCLNSYALNHVKKWFEFDPNTPFRYDNFYLNKSFDEIIKEIG